MKIKPRKHIILSILLFLLTPALLFATSQEGHSITHQMMVLVFQIGIILFAAKLGGTLLEKLNFPAVIGQLAIGIVIGPYLLGSFPLPGFTEGLFPLPTGDVSSIPVSPALYGIATIASIILLFGAGLETDFRMFLKFSVTGIILGIGGVIVSFILGDITAMYFLNVEFMNPQALFLGVMSTATSVGITAVILSERKKMDSPEGVSIMAGAVIDDILGIILLTIIVGIAGAQSIDGSTSVNWSHIGIVALKAILVFLIFTVLGIVFAHRISSFLKMFKSFSAFSVLALGLALILAAIFEQAGLAMIVGAYVMGLALSKTDLTHVIHNRLRTLHLFFVPVFFTVMGMLVNPRSLASKSMLIFSLVYSVGAVLSKIVGCGLAARFLKFNWLGAIRIGLGMVPRGEVALIVAGIGLSRGVLEPSIFGVAVFMTLTTTIIAPPLLNSSLKVKRSGSTATLHEEEKISTVYDFHAREIIELVEYKIIESFRSEGFFVHLIGQQERIYHILKDTIIISMTVRTKSIEFESDELDVTFIKTVMYETLLELSNTISKLKYLKKPEGMRKELTTIGRSDKVILKKHLNPRSVLVNMKPAPKETLITELVDLLYNNGDVPDRDEALKAVLAREQNMSTGLSAGLAIPHAKIDNVNSIKLAIGLIPEGVDFESIDQQPCKVIILMISPSDQNASHLLLMSNIISIFNNDEQRNALINCYSSHSVMDFLNS